MATPADRTPALSVEEYLAREETSPLRHEYVAGQVYAMSGGTIRHNRIAGRIYARLLAAAGDGPCRVLMNDVKVRVDDITFYYPDVMVACGPVDDGAVVVGDPCLVVEVTSPSTRTTDYREKLAAYQKTATVRAYLIVEQDRRLVERHWRDEAGQWWHATVTPEATAGRVPVPCPETVLTLDEIYAGVTLGSPDASPDDGADDRPARRVREP